MLKKGLVIYVMCFATLCIAHGPIQQRDTTKSGYEFVPNVGQWHPAIRYKAAIPYGNLFLESDALHYLLTNPRDYDRVSQWKHDNPTKHTDESLGMNSVRMRFLGMEYAPKLKAENTLERYYNYYIGNNPANWASKVHPSVQVNYQEIYPGVNLEILGQQGLKYQWRISNPTKKKIASIQIAVEGANRIALKNGQVIIETTCGSITDDRLFVYQQIDDAVVEVNARYTLIDSVIGYEILGAINPEYPLIIDPKLIFSTYSGSFADNFGFTATFDSEGSLYAAGIAQEIPNLNQFYPVTSGAFDTEYNGGAGTTPAGLLCDITISKYDSAGSALLWATYIGGAQNEFPHSLVVDRNDDLIILGTTFSANFPVDSLGYDTTHGGGADIFVSKISSDGTSLLGSTFIGGSLNDGLNQNPSLRSMYADDFRGDIITDDDNHIFVATTSLSGDLPTVNAIQRTKGTAYDGYLFELSPDIHTLNWATFLGGNGSDAFYSIKLDQKDNIYVGGGTTSDNLPATDTAIGPVFIGATDGVIAILDKNTKQLKKLTYWGTEEYDQIYFIDRDTEGRIYATGQTAGSIIKTADVYGQSNRGQFLFRIDTLLQNQDFVTTFGNAINTPNLAPSALLVDVCGHIYFSGWGSNVDPADPTTIPGSTQGLIVSDDAEQSTTDNQDFYVIVFGKDAKNLLYATYFGGNVTGDHVDGGTSRFDKRGVMYQSVCGSCPPSTDGQIKEVSDFPTTPGAAFENNKSVRCSNVSFKIDLQIRSAVISDFVAAPVLGCAPHSVQFTSTSVLGRSFLWDFGDGNTATELNPLHTFLEPGKYTVSLTVTDTGTCNMVSTYERIIEVLDQSIAAFEADFEGCSNTLTLTNQSEGAFSYRWDFGDGNSSSEANPKYQYEEAGNYTISLFVNENTLCSDQTYRGVNIESKAIPTIKLYNVFTPNGDGVNDCFSMDGDFLECKDYLLKIYNRWGELVFSTPNPKECWRGNHMKQKNILPSGTYFYLLYLGKNVQELISGMVELIKD
jgi:gliding motility-associated-like protein